MNTNRMLINFRVPEDLVEAFDDTCRFKSMNRTATLIQLMREHVIDKSDEIQRWNTVYEMTGKARINRL